MISSIAKTAIQVAGWEKKSMADVKSCDGRRASTPCRGKPSGEALVTTVVCRHCGDEFDTPQWRLQQGKGKYCGTACANEAKKGFHAKYPAEYMAYYDARRRCTNPYHLTNKINYKDKGIKFLFESFEQFINYIGPRPDGSSLDRIDNNGDYKIGNVRWATAQQQACNRNTNKRYTFNGETLCESEWAKRLGITIGAITARIEKYGWSVEKAVTTPSTTAAAPVWDGGQK